MKKYLATLILTLGFSVQNSFADEFSGNVKGFYVNNNGVALVTMENGTTQPNCPPGVWQFTFNTEDNGAKEWVSMLLTARTTQSNIKVGYSPNTSNYCSVSYFYFL
ncbi:MAG: hypothetical protein JKY54_04735 [Flavobacteriales bacterium]|nr:hypothetical protein [Flavobacteriales bacterium]